MGPSVGPPNDQTHPRHKGARENQVFPNQGNKGLEARVTYSHRTCSWTLLFLRKIIPSTSRVALQKKLRLSSLSVAFI